MHKLTEMSLFKAVWLSKSWYLFAALGFKRFSFSYENLAVHQTKLRTMKIWQSIK